jgi:hypothetical protein
MCSGPQGLQEGHKDGNIVPETYPRSVATCRTCAREAGARTRTNLHALDVEAQSAIFQRSGPGASFDDVDSFHDGTEWRGSRCPAGHSRRLRSRGRGIPTLTGDRRQTSAQRLARQESRATKPNADQSAHRPPPANPTTPLAGRCALEGPLLPRGEPEWRADQGGRPFETRESSPASNG